MKIFHFRFQFNFGHFGNQLAEILLLLTKNRLVLRAGIVAVRYIHHRYINPWIIHSYKILRLEKESHEALPEGSVYVLDSEDETINKENEETSRVTTAANLFYNQPVTNNNLKRKSSVQEGPPEKMIVIYDKKIFKILNEYFFFLLNHPYFF